MYTVHVLLVLLRGIVTVAWEGRGGGYTGLSPIQKHNIPLGNFADQFQLKSHCVKNILNPVDRLNSFCFLRLHMLCHKCQTNTLNTKFSKLMGVKLIHGENQWKFPIHFLYCSLIDSK